MKNALPLLVAGGAAVLLMSGKKKKKTTPEGTDEEPMSADDAEADEGDGPTTTGDEYGKVASGVRNDRRGSHAWRIMFEEDGYHAQTMQGNTNFSPVKEEIGISASLKAAKEMLRDHFNQAILDAGYSESDFTEDPVATRSVTRVSIS